MRTNVPRVPLTQEFDALASRLGREDGWKGALNAFSRKCSLSFTAFAQYLGANKNLRDRHAGKRFILNIGSGDVFPDHCVNADLFPTLGGLLRHLVRGNLPKSNCLLNILYRDANLESIADGVVFSHVLEHIPPHRAREALLNLKIILKPGGTLRLSVPSLDAYDRSEIPPDQGAVNRMIAKNSLIYGWHHRFMYDADLLAALLTEAGFEDVQETPFGEGPLADTDVTRRRAETLCLTARRGG